MPNPDERFTDGPCGSITQITDTADVLVHCGRLIMSLGPQVLRVAPQPTRPQDQASRQIGCSRGWCGLQK